MSKVLPPTEASLGTADSVEAKPRRLWVRALGALLVVISVVAALYLLIGYVAWQSGQAQRRAEQETAVVEQVARQLELAEQDMAGGSHNLAQRRIEWILEQVPNQPEALALQQQNQAAINMNAPQTAPVAALPTTGAPTATPEPSPTPGLITNPQSEIQRLRRLAARQQWEQLLTDTKSYLRQFPNVERQAANELLYEAYLNIGIQQVESTTPELGLYYLEQAEELKGLPLEAEEYRFWASLYLQGISFYGVNWDASAYYFRDLCLSAPFYQDACSLLGEVLLAYGDQLAVSQDWCPAQQVYQEARQQVNSATLNNKLNEASTQCALATPTPSGPISNTVPITNSAPADGNVFVPPSAAQPTRTPSAP